MWVKGFECFNSMESKEPTGKTFRYIDIKSIDNKKHIITEAKDINVSDAPSRASRGVGVGDTLFSMVRPYLENIAYVDEKYENCIASTGFFICKPNRILYPKFLYYLMLSSYVIDGLNAFMKGDNSPSINNDNITTFLYPIPPFYEQQRIIAVIEAAFALIDEIEFNKLSLTKFIKQTKSKVLNLAIRGKLVPQDPNDEPASMLLERIKNEQKTKKNPCDSLHYPFEVPEGWVWCCIFDIGEVITGNTPSKENKNYYGTDFPFYKPNDLDQGLNMCVALDNLSAIGFEKARQIPPFSILVCCIGSIGKVGVTDKICSCNQQINAVIPYKSTSFKYLYYYCISDYFQDQLKINSSATVVSILNKSKFGQLTIPIPPLSEQHRIVTKIEQIFSQLDEIENSIKA